MNKIIDELWYNVLKPGEDLPQDEDREILETQLKEDETLLMNSLIEPQKKLLKSFMISYHQLSLLKDKVIFATGFDYGQKIQEISIIFKK